MYNFVSEVFGKLSCRRLQSLGLKVWTSVLLYSYQVITAIIFDNEGRLEGLSEEKIPALLGTGLLHVY